MEVPGSSSSRKSEFLPQLRLYVLGRPLDLTNQGRARMGGKTNKVDGFGYFRRDLVITRPTHPTSAEVCPFLKHGVHRRLLLTGTAAAHKTLYEVLCRFNIVRVGTRVSSIVPVLPRRDTVGKDFAMFCSGMERRADSLIPKDQHPVIMRLEVFGNLVTIQIGLHQGL